MLNFINLKSVKFQFCELSIREVVGMVNLFLHMEVTNVMSIMINIYYKGEKGSAKNFVMEMIQSGTVDAIRNESGNIRYDYFFPMDDAETVLLIDSWENQEDLDNHHKTPMMNKIMGLREKYNLHMKVERYISDDEIPQTDQKYIRE